MEYRNSSRTLLYQYIRIVDCVLSISYLQSIIIKIIKNNFVRPTPYKEKLPKQINKRKKKRDEWK